MGRKIITGIILLPVVIILWTYCSRPGIDGQQQHLASPSGNYFVEMPIYKSTAEKDFPVWTPTIKNISGEIVYIDRASDLSGYHNSYWKWEKDAAGDDVLSIYNSDTGEVHHYCQKKGTWEKRLIAMQ